MHGGHHNLRTLYSRPRARKHVSQHPPGSVVDVHGQELTGDNLLQIDKRQQKTKSTINDP